MVKLEGLFREIENNDLKHFRNKSFLNVLSITDISIRGCTYLSWAVRKANVQTINYLIDLGSDVNAREPGGATPLLLAIHLDRFDVVQLLISKGANIAERDSYDTPLTLAIRESSFEIIEYLIRNGADTEDSDLRGFTPATSAMKGNKIEVLKLLLQKEGARTSVDSSNNTPLVAAIRNNWSLEMIKCLLEHCYVDESKNEKTPLAWAAESGNLDVVKILLEDGANINQLSQNGKTALGTAVEFGKTEIVKYLTEQNANVCKSKGEGRSPLAIAIDNEDSEMVKFLLDHGAEFQVDIFIVDAVLTKNLEIVRLMTEKGALVDNEYTSDALFNACNEGSTDIAKLLIENGAQLHEPTNGIICFLEERNFEIVKLLTENNADLAALGETGHTPLTKSVEAEDFEMVKHFVERGAPVNQVDANGRTALAIAADKNDFKTFQYLIDCGATATDKEQSENPRLVRYFRLAKESSLKRGNQDQYSNQEEADQA